MDGVVATSQNETTCRQKCCVRRIPVGWRNKPRGMEKNLSIIAAIIVPN
jgi:hypothetical protein